ncbi:hypothetical protein GOV07_03495 [Candidatus Woesearchaeota archaeon]|nr:hypothetical protein [Candidatus Woesearchaeota archaeon]
MVLVKLLGLVDLVAAAMLALAFTELFPGRWVLYIAIILTVKGLFFLKDPVSKFDVVIALYMLLTIVVNIKLLSILFAIYLGFKGLYSLF